MSNRGELLVANFASRNPIEGGMPYKRMINKK